MRIADLLRAMANIVDAEQRSSDVDQNSTIIDVSNMPITQGSAVSRLTPVAVDNKPDSEKTTMIPPLQQKIELLKRAVSVDNEFDDGFDQEYDREDEIANQLTDIKKLAGLNTTIQQELVNDEPLDQ